MGSLADAINAELARQQREEELAANQQMARRSGRNQMLGTGLGVLGALGGGFAGSPAGSAAITNALGLGGGSAAAGGGASLMAASTPLSVTGGAGAAGAGGSTLMGTLGAAAPYALPVLAAGGLAAVVSNQNKGRSGDQRMRDQLSNEHFNEFYGDKDRPDRLTYGDVDFYRPGGGYDPGADAYNGSKYAAPFQIDPNREGASEVIGWLNPLMNSVLADAPERFPTDFVGEFGNAALTSSDPKSWVRSVYENKGYDRDKAYTDVLNMKGLDEGTRDAYLAAIDDLFGVKNPNQGKGRDSMGRLDTGL